MNLLVLDLTLNVAAAFCEKGDARMQNYDSSV